MRNNFFLSLSVILIYCSCSGFEKGSKTFVKSISLPGNQRIDWYVTGSLSGTGPDYLQFSQDEDAPFFSTFYLSDVRFQNDTLYLSLWKDGYELDKAKLGNMNISIDTVGKGWNRAENRIDRLRRRGVDIDHPHFVDTFCEKGGCE